MGPDMPQYLDANGNPIAAPAKVYLDDNGEPIKQTVTPTPPEKPEGFWESLGHTFGIGKEEAEAQNKELKEHPIRFVARALAGPAGMLAEGGYHGFMRTTGEAGQAMDAALKEKNPYRAVEHAAYALPFVGAGIQRGVEQLGPNELINRAEVGTALGTAIQTAPLVADAAAVPIRAGESKIGSILKSKYGPREIPVGGEKVPVTVGEAEPESAAGRKQLSLKRSGAGAAKFEKVEKAQQEAAKNVIKKTAQRASGQIGPLQAEPGAVVNDAATASFAQAAPLYDNLDASLKTVPDTLQNVSKLVDTAIGRARKLGVNVAEDGGDISKIRPDKDGAIQWGGSKISKASHPDRWAKLVDEGIIDESGNGTPIKAYRNVISQLKSMLRASSDGATRLALSKEIETMTRGMDTALEGTGLEKTWHEADRLWRQGKARIDVSKAISDATKGPRAAITPPGMSEVPTEMQGGSLVKALDKLQDDGTLEDAFTPEEGKNLRQSALILDRIQKTSTGTGYGESGSRSRAIAHILRGAPGPMVGAGIGGAAGMLSGHGFIVGAEAGGFAGFIVQSIGERALVNVMTKLDGVRALDAVADAKTPAEVNSAMAKLAAVAAASAPKKRPGDLLRQAQ